MVLGSAIGRLECGAWDDGHDDQNKEKKHFYHYKKIKSLSFYLCCVS